MAEALEDQRNEWTSTKLDHGSPVSWNQRLGTAKQRIQLSVLADVPAKHWKEMGIFVKARRDFQLSTGSSILVKCRTGMKR